ncbi:MAG TPA: Cro/Cl family transcriptional regulator [Peptococcaceae bacterium]|nr:Cro/Cl family transcriptional regulator [Peptococcaceae bacterium]
MPIRCRLSVLMGEKKVNQLDVARGTGLSKTTVNDLYHERVKMIAFDTLERLCKFFGCNVGDILTYVEEREGAGDAQC